jgi:hypothetical protein
MAATPEGKVKDKIRKTLNAFEDVWWTAPVPYGYGESTLDFLCGVKFRGMLAFFAIEAKAPKKHPTPRQVLLIEKLRNMGAKVFVIDGDEGIDELRIWLTQVKAFNDASRS